MRRQDSLQQHMGGVEMRKIIGMTVAVILGSAVAGCGGEDEEGAAEKSAADLQQPEPEKMTRAVAVIEPRSGSEMTGMATFTVNGGFVQAIIMIANAEPGEHAVHIHEFGDCSAEDGTSAGGHWNPTGEDHGKWGEPPYHLGDIGNIVVDEDGTGSIAFGTDNWSLGTGEENDVVGRAIIIHSGADDFVTQPTGDAGGRQGCGVIRLEEES